MQLQSIKSIFATIWVLCAVVLAVMAGITSAIGLTAVAAFGLLPPLAVLLLWNDPSPTMSEIINKARR